MAMAPTERCLYVLGQSLPAAFRTAAGDLAVRFGVPLLDAYLEFLAVRSRPNTVLAVAYDLKVFFTVVGKPPAQVVAADVLAFVTARNTPAGPPTGFRPSTAAGRGCRRGRCGGGCRACRGCSRSCTPAGMWRRVRCPRGCRPGVNVNARVRVCRWSALLEARPV